MTARSMEKTQLYELIRRTARDTAASGWDERTGYGILDIPSLLQTPLPAIDPQEPNDDIDQVTAGGMFKNAKASIDGSGRNARLTARLDAAEDPSDVYRLSVPARRKVTVAVSADARLALSLWNITATTVARGVRGRLATSDRPGKTETVTWTNPTRSARIVYTNIRPSGAPTHLDSTYTLSVRVSRR